MNYKFSSYSDPLWLLGILNFSVAHAPKSINLHFSEQNGLNLLVLERSASLSQLGHLLGILKRSNFQLKFNQFKWGDRYSPGKMDINSILVR